MVQDNVVVYTVHKAASMLLFRAMDAYCQNNGLALYSPNSRDEEFRLAVSRKEEASVDCEFPVQPCLVGPVRVPKAYSNLRGHKTMIHLRDPRDVLTSMFYSFTFSHAGIDEEVRQKRIRMGVDKFVLSREPDMRNRFKTYCRWIENDDSIFLTTYESLYDDFEGWLNATFRFWGAEDPELVATVAKTEDPQKISNRGENINKHKRQATPGDHARKLSPETIAILNDRFAFYFEFLARNDGAVTLGKSLEI